MEKSSEGLLLLDKSLYIKTGNPEAEKLLQQPLDSIIGKHVEELLPSGYTVDSLIKAGKLVFGNLTVFYQPLPLPKPSGIIILCENSEESSLHNAIAHCKQLVGQLENPEKTDPVEIFITDDEGITQAVITNDSEQFYGVKASTFLGRNVRESEEKGYFFPSLTRLVLESKEQVTAIQETKTGRKFLSSAQPVYDSSKNIHQIITISRDITDFYVLKRILSEIEETIQRKLTEDIGLGQDSAELAGYIVKSPVMIKVIQNIRRIALFDSTVLLTGETGTGKGALANLLHRLSPRKTGEFVHVNCGAIPEHLMESEFFGYVPGSFTGASKGGKKGLVELAQGGILFLDEVDCLPINLQAKLLHLIQEREFMPVGGTRRVGVDVRFVAATNKDLLKLIAEGLFREDLYYRLNVVPIVIPPLRERKEEILPLASCFLDRLCKRYGVEREFSASAVKVLLNYQWPGNVRELENVIERCAVTSRGSCITADLLEEYLQESRIKLPPSQTSSKAAAASSVLNNKVEKLEKAVLEDALRKYGSTRKVAAHLGVNQSTVVRKMKKYGITSGTTET